MPHIIVKVQVPLASNIKDPPAYVYNEDRSYCEHVPVTPELLGWMRGRVKAYFVASRSNNKLVLEREAEDQKW